MGGVFVLLDDCSRVLTKRYGVIADNEFDTGSGQAAEIYEPPPSSLENAINSAALCLTLTAFTVFFAFSTGKRADRHWKICHRMSFAFYFKLFIPAECRPFRLDPFFNESALDRFQNPLGNARTTKIACKMGVGKKHHPFYP